MDFTKQFNCTSYACHKAGGEFEKHTITRRGAKANDVVIEIMYAGICHTDIHQAREEWGPAKFPMVPGHEIAGIVRAVGTDVKKFVVGDQAGVGCMVGACKDCEMCN
jgi:uncharacterized zinc-type alcohol dehydrogenase-like protein